jgi:hypothetical protein
MKHIFTLLFLLVTLPAWSQLTTMHATLSGIGIKSLNGLTAKSQTFATGTTGTDFNISSSGTVHTFNIPTASATNRGLLSTADWTTFNNAWSKSGNSGTTAGTNFLGTTDNVGLAFKTNNTEYLRITNTGNFGIGTTNPASKIHIAQSATATANYGTISLGSAPFDGVSVGFFNGSASGTQFAINSSSGFIGDLINCQVGGTNKFILRASGTSFLGGAIQIAGSVNISSGTLTTGAVNSSGITSNNGADTYFQNTGIITVTTPMYSYLASKTFQPAASAGTYSGFEFNSTINQTGMASGAVRGFYANAVLTSAMDYRAFDANNNVGKGYYQTGTAVNAFSGKTYIGGTTSAAALLHLAAGTATANTAPLKLTSGTNLTTAEAGAIEYDGTEFYATNSGASRTILSRCLKGSATLDFGSTAAQSSADLTITVTGAADGDTVDVGAPNASVNANTSYYAWVSAANTVTVRFNNYSSGAVDPASGTFKVTVNK